MMPFEEWSRRQEAKSRRGCLIAIIISAILLALAVWLLWFAIMTATKPEPVPL